jgi:hypothetical protein
LAEVYKNAGGDATQYIPIVKSKYEAAEGSMENVFHEGMLSNGTGSGGQQLLGAAGLVSTTPATGTVGGIDRSNADASWFRNQKFDTAGDWTDGAVDVGNVKRFLDKLINSTMRGSKSLLTCLFLGDTHWEAATAAFQAHQQIVNESEVGEVGFQSMRYRGIKLYYGGGINYSGASAMTATRTYGFCTKPGGVNLYFHNKAEFDMLEPVNASDSAAVSRLIFTMAAMTIGGLAKFNTVGFD